LRLLPRSWNHTLPGCPSGQREQTVNLPAIAYGGSNPSPGTTRIQVCVYASLAQWQSTSMVRRGSRVQIPEEAPFNRVPRRYRDPAASYSDGVQHSSRSLRSRCFLSVGKTPVFVDGSPLGGLLEGSLSLSASQARHLPRPMSRGRNAGLSLHRALAGEMSRNETEGVL
jgi:hypothetical protein